MASPLITRPLETDPDEGTPASSTSPLAESKKGWHTSKEGLAFARAHVRRRDAFNEVLTKHNDRVIRNYRNYVADPAIRDPRNKTKERWRSFVMPPKPFANTNSAAATISDIITSVDPIVQVTRRKDLQQEKAIYAENIVSYWMDGNQFDTRILPVLARSAEVGATQWLKMTWVDRRRRAQYRYTIDDYENWWNQAFIAARQTGVAMPDRRVDVDAHNVWIEQMRGAGFPDLPDFPVVGESDSAAFIGPWYTLPMPWNIAYDPFVDDLQAQGVIYERMVFPTSYVDSLSQRDDPRAPYDADAVAYARRRNKPSERFTSHEAQYYECLGLDPGAYPSQQDSPFDELIECYTANDPERQFAVILNGVCCINKDYRAAFPHGDNPYSEVHRVRMPSSAIGLSPFTPTETLLYESVGLRSSRLDAVTVATNPAWGARGAGASGITSINKLVPGGVYQNIGKEDLTPLTFPIPDQAFQEDRQNAFDIDEGWGIDSSARGQQASVGRVSLGEYQGRRTQATLPLIGVAREIESAVERTIPWGFHLLMAFAPQETMVRLSGSLQRLDNIQLAEALKLDLRFQGATQTRNRSEMAQIVLLIQDKFKGVLGPIEQRELLKQVWSLNGLQDPQGFLDEETGKQMQAKFLGIQLGPQQGIIAPPGGPGGLPAMPPGAPGLPGAPQGGGAPAMPTGPGGPGGPPQGGPPAMPQ